MITANIRFITNNLMADLTCKGSELQSNLQSMGILTAPSLIMLDNSRTLQIQLSANDEIGEQLNVVVATASSVGFTIFRRPNCY